jgi:hypothetical protein
MNALENNHLPCKPNCLVAHVLRSPLAALVLDWILLALTVQSLSVDQHGGQSWKGRGWVCVSQVLQNSAGYQGQWWEWCRSLGLSSREKGETERGSLDS